MYQLNKQEQTILEQAQGILTKVMESTPVYQRAEQFTDPQMARFYFQVSIGYEDRENFMVLFLDSNNRLIKGEVLFQGNVRSAYVSVREVIRRALNLNASNLIIGHNHPSGSVEPSEADKLLTRDIKKACGLMGIDLIDHVIVSGSEHFSFAENFLLLSL